MSASDRRALIWGAAVILGAVLVTRAGLPAVTAYQAAAERLAADRLAHEGELALLAADTNAFVEAGARAELQAHRILFAGDDPLLAADEFIDTVERIATLTSVTIADLQESPYRVGPAEWLLEFPLTIRGTTDMAGLVQFERLLSGGSLVRMDEVRIERVAGDSSVNVLTFSMTMTGFGRLNVNGDSSVISLPVRRTAR